MNHFKGKQFQQDVIIVAVGYYLRYNLSYREVQEILYDRGINWNGNSFFDKFYKVQNFFPYAIPIVLDNEPPRM